MITHVSRLFKLYFLYGFSFIPEPKTVVSYPGMTCKRLTGFLLLPHHLHPIPSPLIICKKLFLRFIFMLFSSFRPSSSSSHRHGLHWTFCKLEGFSCVFSYMSLALLTKIEYNSIDSKTLFSLFHSFPLFVQHHPTWKNPEMVEVCLFVFVHDQICCKTYMHHWIHCPIAAHPRRVRFLIGMIWKKSLKKITD